MKHFEFTTHEVKNSNHVIPTLFVISSRQAEKDVDLFIVRFRPFYTVNMCLTKWIVSNEIFGYSQCVFDRKMQHIKGVALVTFPGGHGDCSKYCPGFTGYHVKAYKTEENYTSRNMFSSKSKQPRNTKSSTANELEIELRQNTSIFLVSSTSPKGINDTFYAIVDISDN